jgi:pimeloyl-ACP methyl ester carboxylesterase
MTSHFLKHAAIWMLGFFMIGPADALEREEVSWTNGDVRLAGTLYVPEGRGRHPVFIYLHGSGPETRRGMTYIQYARNFAKNGIAMLVYDKRGAGESTGDWKSTDYADLAEDAVKGIEYLMTRKDIDKKSIGVIGASEGGWTGPIAVNTSPHVTHAILTSAPPMSPNEQGYYEWSLELREEGMSEEDIAEIMELERQRDRVRKTDTGWEALDEAIAVAKRRPWYEAAGSPGRPNKKHSRYEWMRRNMDYDPLPALKKLDVPVLLLYGAKDPLVDAKTSAEVMEKLAEDEGKDFTIYTYPDGVHNLTANGVTYTKEHWDRIFGWLKKKGFK